MNKEIKKFLKGCVFAKKIFTDYYGKDNKAGFAHDKRTHDVARSQCINLLKRLRTISVKEFEIASSEAWSGRLHYDGSRIKYTAGQFYDLEAPQALSAVLHAIEDNRKSHGK